MRLPDRNDILDYADGAHNIDAETQRAILNLLASSPILREQMAELKRDLYFVSTQVPDYHPTAAFGAEVTRLSQAWVKLAYARKFSLRQFYRSREFFFLMAFVGVGVLALLALVGMQLLAR